MWPMSGGFILIYYKINKEEELLYAILQHA
jgi:hypothetical protein